MRAVATGTVAYSEGAPLSRYHKHASGMSTDTDHMEEEFIRALGSVRVRAAISLSSVMISSDGPDQALSMLSEQAMLLEGGDSLRVDVERSAIGMWVRGTTPMRGLDELIARFSELRAAVPGITPRALALALKDLQAAELIERRIEDAYPPRTLYSPTAQGRRLQRIVT